MQLLKSFSIFEDFAKSRFESKHLVTYAIWTVYRLRLFISYWNDRKGWCQNPIHVDCIWNRDVINRTCVYLIFWNFDILLSGSAWALCILRRMHVRSLLNVDNPGNDIVSLIQNIFSVIRLLELTNRIGIGSELICCAVTGKISEFKIRLFSFSRKKFKATRLKDEINIPYVTTRLGGQSSKSSYGQPNPFRPRPLSHVYFSNFEFRSGRHRSESVRSGHQLSAVDQHVVVYEFMIFMWSSTFLLSSYNSFLTHLRPLTA